MHNSTHKRSHGRLGIDFGQEIPPPVAFESEPQRLNTQNAFHEPIQAKNQAVSLILGVLKSAEKSVVECKRLRLELTDKIFLCVSVAFSKAVQIIQLHFPSDMSVPTLPVTFSSP